MHERIRELAERCYHRYSEHNIDWEKFAELIVRECAKFVEDKFDFCGDEIIIAEEVRKHFGVEE